MSNQLTYEAFANFFLEADTDYSGELSIDELIENLSKHGYVGKEQQIRRAFKDADIDGDGQISFEEYMTAMGFTLTKKHKGTAIWRSFQEFDKSNCGFVVFTQVDIILQRVRKHFIYAEFRKLTDLAAKMKDSSGKLNYMAFLQELVKMGMIEVEGITEIKEAKQQIAQKEVKEEVTAKKTQQVSMTAKPAPEVAVCPGAGVPWSMSTHYFTRNSNEAMGVLGNLPQLGKWHPNQTVLAKESPAGSGNWTCSVALPPNAPFEWKWVVVPMSRERVSRWELDPNPPRGNRTSNSGSSPHSAHYAWID